MSAIKYKPIIDYELFKLKKYECGHIDVKAKWLVSYYIYKSLEKDMFRLLNATFRNNITMYGIPVYIIENVDEEYIKLVVEL